MHILTRNGDVPYWECISSPGTGMCLTRNGELPHWECISPPGMGMCLTRNEDLLHWECISSPGMGMCLTGNGDVPHRECSLYRVNLHSQNFFTSVVYIDSSLGLVNTLSDDRCHAWGRQRLLNLKHLVVLFARPISHTSIQYMDIVKIFNVSLNLSSI